MGSFLDRWTQKFRDRYRDRVVIGLVVPSFLQVDAIVNRLLLEERQYGDLPTQSMIRPERTIRQSAHWKVVVLRMVIVQRKGNPFKLVPRLLPHRSDGRSCQRIHLERHHLCLLGQEHNGKKSSDRTK
jgi:hypothetical protein